MILFDKLFATVNSATLKKNQNSVLMRPTINSRGSFVNRSILGGTKQLESTLTKKVAIKNSSKRFSKPKYILPGHMTYQNVASLYDADKVSLSAKETQ